MTSFATETLICYDTRRRRRMAVIRLRYGYGAFVTSRCYGRARLRLPRMACLATLLPVRAAGLFGLGDY